MALERKPEPSVTMLLRVYLARLEQAQQSGMQATKEAILAERERCAGICEFYGHKGMANAMRETLP